MRRIIMLSGLLLAFLILLFPACAPRSTSIENPLNTGGVEKDRPQNIGKELRESSWDTILEKANREGKIVIYGPPGVEQRQALTEEFMKTYPKINVDYVAAPGAAVAQKIISERKAGIFLVDLHIGGTTTMLTTFKSFAVPVQPLLILPEVKDGKNWLGGKIDFADNDEKYNLVFTTAIKVGLAYNSEQLEPKKAAQLSFWDLTKPEWKGKLVMTDTRMAGPGLTTANFFILNPNLGESFVRALAKNDVVLSRDERMLAEWVARGKYAAQIGPGTSFVLELQKAGAPIKLQGTLKEGAVLTAAYGSLMVFDNGPHPNATIIYLNWLLNREAQLLWAKASGYSSRRVDVPTGFLDPETIPKAGEEYISEYKEKYTGKNKEDLLKLMNEVFGR